MSRSDDRDIIVNKDRVVKVVRAVDKLIVIALVDVTERRENVGYLCLQYKSRSVQSSSALLVIDIVVWMANIHLLFQVMLVVSGEPNLSEGLK